MHNLDCCITQDTQSCLATPQLLLQVVKALTAADTAYSVVPSKGITDSSLLAGKDATLVALVQASSRHC